MIMQLVDVWASKDSWAALAKLKKPPKVAYRLMKYQAKVRTEIEICDSQRRQLILDAANAEQGDQVTLAPGSPEYDTFTKKFLEFLNQDSDMEPLGMNMDELIEQISEHGNVLSENDLTLLSPFFQKETETPDSTIG